MQQGASEGNGWTFINGALGTVGVGVPIIAAIVRNWPSTSEEMDDILGFQGVRIPDGSNSIGRNKVVWQPSDQIKITYEQHPYHIGAPVFHTGPHWHLDIYLAGINHVRYLPGDFMP